MLHENLFLRVEVDKLNNEIEKYKMLNIRKETKKKLKYIRSKSVPASVRSTIKEIGTKVPDEHTNAVKIKENVTLETKIKNSDEHNRNKEKDTEIIIINPINSTRDDLEMVQVSENGSKTSSELSIASCLNLPSIRAASAPEITQSLYSYSNS